ncbi:single-stranded-DNA-specific exonuclease RecJ [Sphingomicrobium astaxanthinifaciens]|uniref:single-stranded-DNA-specific exonuclease RecJ n=1 Tax=Sphingomicrobium astaxanthinifaciens TaxID=1227949 RepID=UPI001FCB3585|nr:single-stranded-DNA-specific exonuclease RecJ [Sphingomicrobium astaxanthinifaciens]MCJ7420862.1 single-stranded-DNA-specific exonuclease RecJ [Sphingomicrobium astaxanthinifaciens]
MSRLDIERSLSGQPWRWRYQGGDDLTRDLTDQLLLARGITQADLPRHRSPRLRDFLPDPSTFRDMDKAAARVADAIEAGETIALFGDYDVDGATSAALLARLLRQLGAEPMLYIPDRLMEGYGPSGAALVELKRRGAGLCITVDCGAQAFAALDEAAAAGLEVIVCDHHKCDATLPTACAVINPNRLDESELGAAHGHLAAVGMAFLLGVALLRELRRRGRFVDGAPEPDLLPLLDLVALGTVADVAKLQTLNRAFVTQGLKVMASQRNVGLTALARVAGLKKAPAARDLGFALGPRINAGGRVGEADLGVRLLTTEDAAEAEEIAARLDRYNEERRAIEAAVTEAALEAAEAQADSALLCVAGAGWHPGVVGIVASRLKERFRRPALVIGLDEDGVGKGSGRSISGVDLGAAILAARDTGLLLAGGGHAMAAGVTVAPGGTEALHAFLAERLADEVAAARAGQALVIDAVLAAGGVAGALCDRIEAAGPYGAGWPAPRVAVGPVRLLNVGVVGQGHVRLRAVGDDQRGFKAIAFRAADREWGQALLGARPDQRFWLAGVLKRDEWTGGDAAEMHLEDAAYA